MRTIYVLSMDVCPCCTVYYRQTACQPVTTEVDFEKEHPSQALALPFFDAADCGHHQCYRCNAVYCAGTAVRQRHLRHIHPALPADAGLSFAVLLPDPAQHPAAAVRLQAAGGGVLDLRHLYGLRLLGGGLAHHRCAAHRRQHCLAAGGHGFVFVCAVRRHHLGRWQWPGHPLRRRDGRH